MKIIFDERQIKSAVKKMAAKINRDFKGRELIIIAVLKGSFVFLADLARYLKMPVKIDFAEAVSYEGMKSRGKAEIRKKWSLSLANRNVLLLEDTAETGMTLRAMKKMIEAEKPRLLRVATLIDKPSCRKVEIEPDYVGFVMPDIFVVGYGMDWNGQHRNLPDIRIFKDKK